jgi:outer membrane protein TolC
MRRSVTSSTILLLIACTAGCQTYAADPLTLDGERARWRDAASDAASIGAFAERLKAAGSDFAVAFDLSDGLDLREAAIAALLLNPTLARLRAEIAVEESELARPEGSAEHPELDLSMVSFPNGSGRAMALSGGLSITLGQTGLAEASADHASAQADAARWRLREGAAVVLGELRAAWLHWSAASQRIALLTQTAGEIAAMQAIASRLVAAGELSAAQGAAFEIEALELNADRMRADREAGEALLEIRRLMGVPPDGPLLGREAADLFRPAIAPGLAAWDAAASREALIARAPAIGEALARYRAHEHALRAEIEKQGPRLTLGLGVEREGEGSRLDFGLGLPLPLIDLNLRGISRATAERAAARASAGEVLQQVAHEIARNEAALDAARQERTWLADELGPAVDRQVASAEALAAAGELDVFLTLDALRRRAAAREALLEATVREGLALNRLHVLCGIDWLAAANAAALSGARAPEAEEKP